MEWDDRKGESLSINSSHRKYPRQTFQYDEDRNEKYLIDIPENERPLSIRTGLKAALNRNFGCSPEIKAVKLWLSENPGAQEKLDSRYTINLEPYKNDIHWDMDGNLTRLQFRGGIGGNRSAALRAANKLANEKILDDALESLFRPVFITDTFEDGTEYVLKLIIRQAYRYRFVCGWMYKFEGKTYTSSEIGGHPKTTIRSARQAAKKSYGYRVKEAESPKESLAVS